MLTPTYDRLVVKRLESEDRYANGLIIPDNRKYPSPFVEVIAVGPGKYSEEHGFRAIGVAVGDKVIVKPKAGTDVEINGEDYIILIEDQIEAIVVDDGDTGSVEFTRPLPRPPGALNT